MILFKGGSLDSLVCLRVYVDAMRIDSVLSAASLPHCQSQSTAKNNLAVTLPWLQT